MDIKLRKSISLLLTVLLLFFYVAYPVLSYAQEVTPTDTPTPTTTTIDNSATVSTGADTTSNSIGATPTPNDTPTDTPTPTPDGTNISNAAQVTDNSQSNANTGDNNIVATPDATTNDATPSGSDNSSNQNPSDNSNNTSPSSPTSVIATGNATSVTSIVNDVNTNSVNSSVVNQTLNIFVAQNGSIDLSDPFSIAADAISTHPEDSTINVSVTNVNNYAYITNDVASQALTGQNSINTPDQSASIITGNAFSAISLLNKVNFTVVNSQIHLVTINIFGNLNGNIILPDANASTNCSGCGVNIANINNTAQVTDNVNSIADTGNNSIIASGSATITTGSAVSTVNNLNIVNTDVLGANAEVLFINDYGTWNGNFIGWSNFDPIAGGASLVFYNLSPNTGTNGSTQTNIVNNASVTNNVSSLASSGSNSINGGNSSIVTGNSFSAISLMNFINTNFINSFGFFGFINIFGNWTGNIGGKAQFAALNTQNNNQENPTSNISTDSSSNSDITQEQGGSLSVENSNNVAAFVYPGDTVTFFLKVRNTGTGKVYGTTLNLSLVYNGQSVGTTSFSLGDIAGGKGVKVSTAIVLPKGALPGVYTAVATATGNVGPDNSTVSSSANSYFTIFGNTLVAGASTNISNNPKTDVLGSSNKNNVSFKNTSETVFYLSLILLLLTAYFSIRIIRGRKYVFEVISSNSLKEKLHSLKMLIL